MIINNERIRLGEWDFSDRLRTEKDPVKSQRIDRTKDHKLIDIIAIAICGMLCGADNWVAMEVRFVEVKSL